MYVNVFSLRLALYFIHIFLVFLLALESENIMFGIIMQWKLRKGIGFTHPDVLPLLLTLRYDNMTPSYLYHAAELIMESPFSEIKTKMTDKTMFDYMLICNRVREAMHVKFGR